MSKKSRAPIVAIVGRANVGKSSLFNAFLRRRETIVAREAGTTRDSISAKMTYADRDYWLVDTAGLKDPNDDFEATIQQQIEQATNSADLILVVIEADTIITDDDRKVAKMALRSGCQVMLLINKCDRAKNKSLDNYQRLGISDITYVSATTRYGIADVLDKISDKLPPAYIKEESDKIVISLIGRPNVGKSQMFNKLAKKQQAIVADVAGTTRDINKTSIRYENKNIEILDTAGIRRNGKIEVGIEKFSVIRTLSAIEQSDVCLFLMDVNEHSTQLDQKIAGMIKDSGKGIVIVITKWDDVQKDAYTHDQIAAEIKHHFQFMPYAPLIFTSSVTGQNISKLFELVTEIHTMRSRHITTPVLNRWLKNCTYNHPPAGLKNSQPKLNYITQTDESVPSFKIFGTQTKLLHWSYKRYLEKQLREEFSFSGTPIRFWFIEKIDGRKTVTSHSKSRGKKGK